MDQKQTGKFIAEMRRARGLTQKELADLLYISDKTVSKWECGGGLPEVSLMLPLCDALGITVNELLSGKRLQTDEYQKNAEKNMVTLMTEKNEFRLKYLLETLVFFITIIAFVSLCMVVAYVDMPTPTRITLLAVAIIIISIGATVGIVWERTVFSFECSHCKNRFVPTVGAYLAGMHTWSKRYLKCPKCGKKSWCKLSVKTKYNHTENNEKPQE